MFGFSITKPCTSFKCLVNNHLIEYVIMQVPTLNFHFDLAFIHYLSFWTIFRWTKGCWWLRSLVSFKLQT
jgi:hypothetical protein